MTSTSKNKQEMINTYKPLIYIIPKDSSNLNQIVSKKINEIENNQIVKSNDNNSEIASWARNIASFAYVYFVARQPEIILAESIFNLVKKSISKATQKEESSDIGIESEELINSQNKMAQFLEEIDISDWEDFVEQIPFKSIPEELDFPPGHPLPNRFYRVHPLKKKNNRYIPIERFDSLLYEERESELRKILVDLGATEISIQEISSRKNQGSAEAKASFAGAGGVGAGIDGNNEKSNSVNEVIELKPKNWIAENFKPDKYSWLPYEPKWETMVHARLEGGGLSYSIELTSDTSFSLSAQLGLTEGILDNLASLGVEGEFSGLRQEKKIFKVKFINV